MQLNMMKESKCMRKAKEILLLQLVIRMAGFFTIVGYRLFKLKSRGGMKMSVYLIHMGVMAQGFVVGAMTIGMYSYTYFTDLQFKSRLYHIRPRLGVP
uniref:HIG1 domain-containing protein n=1 Tax=Hucho hucho TaxID=62062 RepID=A0A4W5QG13_9TELE